MAAAFIITYDAHFRQLLQLVTNSYRVWPVWKWAEDGICVILSYRVISVPAIHVTLRGLDGRGLSYCHILPYGFPFPF